MNKIICRSFALIISLMTIVLFQNCSQNGFQAQMSNDPTISQNLNLVSDSAEGVLDNQEMSEIFAVPQQGNLNLTSTVVSTGNTYYVSLLGSDSNPGTLTKPFRTIAKGIAPLNPGDTLYLRAGIYNQQIDLQGPKKSGTATGWITIAGYPGEVVTLRYTDKLTSSYGTIKARGNLGYFIFRNFIIDGINMAAKTGWQIRDGNHHFILDRLEIKNQSYNGIYLGIANNITIQNSKIHSNRTNGEVGTRWLGIYGRGAYNVTIQNNDIYSNVGGGIQFYPGNPGGVVIRGNRIRGNNHAFNDNVNIGGILIGYDTVNFGLNTQIYNNLIYTNGRTGKPRSGPGISVYNGADQVKIWNNTIYNNLSAGIDVGTSNSTGTVIQNNIILGNGGGAIVNRGVKSIVSNNIVSGLINSFTVSTSDFRLKAGSKAINTGISVSAVKNDFAGLARPRGPAYDIGAYEY